MKPHRRELVEEFVRRHALHHPRKHVAEIGNLKPLFRPRVVPAGRLHCPAMALVPSWDAITEQTPMNIFLRRDLAEVDMRLAYTHEVMHAVLGHRGSISMRRIEPWFHDRDEREAWEATAIALIPEWSYRESLNVRWLARASKVPEWLIAFHPLAEDAGVTACARSGLFR